MFMHTTLQKLWNIDIGIIRSTFLEDASLLSPRIDTMLANVDENLMAPFKVTV